MLTVEDLNDIGAVIRSRREVLDLSQKALAEQAGTSCEWISRFETGRIPHADLSVVLKVLKALDVGVILDPGRQYVPGEDFSDFDAAFTGFTPTSRSPRS